jgi:hypothetical protein
MRDGASLPRADQSVPRASAPGHGWAVRRDWPGGGHEFVGFRLAEEEEEGGRRGRPALLVARPYGCDVVGPLP